MGEHGALARLLFIRKVLILIKANLEWRGWTEAFNLRAFYATCGKNL